MSCNISGLNQVQLLIELHKAAIPSEEVKAKADQEALSVSQARELVRTCNRGTRFRTIHGKVLNISYYAEDIDTSGYNEANGPNAFETVVENIRTLAKIQKSLYQCIDNGDYTGFIEGITQHPELIDRENLFEQDWNKDKGKLTPLFQTVHSIHSKRHYLSDPKVQKENEGQFQILKHLLNQSMVRLQLDDDTVLYKAVDGYGNEMCIRLLDVILNSKRSDELRALATQHAVNTTLLTYCFNWDKKEELKRLAEFSPEAIFARDKQGSTIFHRIAESSRDEKEKLEYLQILFNTIPIEKRSEFIAAINIKNQNKNTPLALSIQKGHLQVANFFLPHISKEIFKTQFKSENLLHLACELPDEEQCLSVIQYLYKKDSDWDVNGLNETNDTCLQIAGKLGYYQEKHKFKVLDLLISKGADVNCRDTLGRTLLHNAVREVDVALTEYLLSHGASPHVMDDQGFTPIDYLKPNVQKYFSRLFGYNQDKHDQDQKENSEKNEAISRLLLVHGAKEAIIPDVGLPETPKALIEDLELEAKLAKEEAVTLDEQETKQLLEDKGRLDELYASLKYEEFYCPSKADVQNTCKQHPNHHYFLEPSRTYKYSQVLHKFTDLNDAQLELLKKLQLSIQDYEKRISSSHSFDEKRERGIVISNDKIDATIKKYGEENILFEFDGGSGEIYVRIYKDLTTKEKVALKVEQNYIKNFQQAFNKAWQEMMEACEKSQAETRYFGHESNYRDFISKNPLKCKDKEFYLISPSFPQNLYFLTVSKHLDKKQQQELECLPSYKRSAAIMQKNRLGYEFLHQFSSRRSIDKYIEQFPTIKRQIGKHSFEFVDLTQADDYRFFTNTVLSHPACLRELIEGDPNFFESAPFISMTQIDKETRGFAGGHQSNLLFPLYLVIDVPVSALAYLGSTDIGSPFACRAGRKIEYLNKTTPTRTFMDWCQAHYQMKVLEKDTTRFVPECPTLVKPALVKSNHYKQPCSLPLYTPEGLYRDTNSDSYQENSYCEAIVQGNAMNIKEKLKGRLLLVDKFFLERYLKEKHGRMDAKSTRSAEKSLEILANIEKLTKGRLRLALIDTNMQGYMKKWGVLSQLHSLEDRKKDISSKLICLNIAFSRHTEQHKEVPQELTDQMMKLKNEGDEIHLESAYLTELGKNPPRVMALREKEKAAAKREAVLLSGGLGAGSGLSLTPLPVSTAAAACAAAP